MSVQWNAGFQVIPIAAAGGPPVSPRAPRVALLCTLSLSPSQVQSAAGAAVQGPQRQHLWLQLPRSLWPQRRAALRIMRQAEALPPC